MTARIEFETPENILVNYQPAGLGTRFMAWIVDSIISYLIVFLLIVCLIALGVAYDGLFEFVEERIAYSLGDDKETKNLMVGIYFSLFLLILNTVSFVYFFMFEYFGHGRTLGKRWMSIRVIGEEGIALNSTKVFLRSVFRIVDSIPIAWLVPLFSKRSKRLGDMVAGTLIVVDQPGTLEEVREELEEGAQREFRFVRIGLDELKQKEVHLIAQLLERAESMDESIRKDLYHKTVDSMAVHFDHELPEASSYERYLRELLQSYYERQHRRLG
ncbi:RDD family protein [Pseudodesulfovibrio sediminis]|uniref:RDD domain-containing protein n=1 Tax=Pseudodesulfovibrio sediminis TaxID=2810563 RepID=A0ABM7P940_9BACT|nr:RDD family protein [Pseudodesulfovibrio sediminis]BCS89563.1 hypothetical protein PSDVSF_28050 [Pseudodesulfovibrio sediminis]